MCTSGSLLGRGSEGCYLQMQLTDSWGSGGERCQEWRLLWGIGVAPACKTPRTTACEMLDGQISWGGPACLHTGSLKGALCQCWKSKSSVTSAQPPGLGWSCLCSGAGASKPTMLHDTDTAQTLLSPAVTVAA